MVHTQVHWFDLVVTWQEGQCKAVHLLLQVRYLLTTFTWKEHLGQ